MLFLAKFFVSLNILFFTLGVVGVFTNEDLGGLEQGFKLLLVAVPINFVSYLTLQSLKPKAISEWKFYLAHLSVGVYFITGLIMLMISKKLPVFALGALGAFAVGAIVIWQMHKMKKRNTPEPTKQ